MKISISNTPKELGRIAAAEVAKRLNAAIAEKGHARLLLSTGASQFDMFEHLIHEQVNWSVVDMFHLDEYIKLPITHPASFRKYLAERFVAHVTLRSVNYVECEGDVNASLAKLNAKIKEEQVDVALIGIGENAHIAFNDPPADFFTLDPYIVVDLDDKCKAQQVGEGWFPTPADVPDQAISMSVRHIMMSKCVISVVPKAVKADAIYQTFHTSISPEVPSTMLKMHPDWTLYLDDASAARLDRAAFAEYLI